VDDEMRRRAQAADHERDFADIKLDLRVLKWMVAATWAAALAALVFLH
jgi:hypothetical protein